MKAVHAARAEGLPVTAQMAGRPIGVMMGIGTALNPFTVRPTYKPIESLPIEEQRRRLRDPGDAAGDPRRNAIGGRSRQARAVPPARHHALRQVLRHGQPAGLRARPGEERCRHRRARRPHAGRGRLRLHPRGRPISLLPGGELCDRRPRADPRDAQRSGLPARPLRRRRALHLDHRCGRAQLHADPLGPRPHARAEVAAGNAGEAPDQRDRQFLRA